MIVLTTIEIILLAAALVLVLRTCQRITKHSTELNHALHELVQFQGQIVNSSQESIRMAKFMVDDVILSHKALQDSYNNVAPALDSIAQSYREVIAAAVVMAASCEMAAESSKSIISFCGEAVSDSKHVADTVAQSYQLLGETQKEVMQSFAATANVAAAASQQAAVTCQESVGAVIGACEGATQLAAKTCHQLLHSAFPNQNLDWSWHHENSFMCYFCQKRFPLTERETIGKYDYCLEHGTARKQRLLREECGVSQS